MIIAILNQKGGTGKTTLAVNLTREYTRRGISSLLVDSDRQGSALRWHEESGGDLIDLTCLPVSTIHKDIIKFKANYERIIIDGFPHINAVTASSIVAANVVLIPVQPSLYDIWATERIELTEGKLKAAFVVSRRIRGTIIGNDIEDQLQKFELPIFSNGTYQRIEYAKAIKEGRTVCELDTEASKEIIMITNELEHFING